MMKRGWPLLVTLLVACGGSAQVTPVPAADAALQSFLRAAADSNLSSMANYWGTARGAAAATGIPADYQKRMVIIQTYLGGAKFRVLSNDPKPGDVNQRVLQVELTRPNCVNVIPFTMVRTSSDHWLVNEFDLEKIGPPGKPCGTADGAPR